MNRTYKFTFFVILLGLPLLAAAGCVMPLPPVQQEAPEYKKVYLGPVPIEGTLAYQTFLLSSKSETAKLSFILDRMKAAPELKYHFEGIYYGWLEAYTGASWLLWHDHKAGEDAHAFILKEALRFHNPVKPTTILFPDKSQPLAAEVFINELDLLEETIQRKNCPQCHI